MRGWKKNFDENLLLKMFTTILESNSKITYGLGSKSEHEILLLRKFATIGGFKRIR
jgi:hypothetical protein